MSFIEQYVTKRRFFQKKWRHDEKKIHPETSTYRKAKRQLRKAGNQRQELDRKNREVNRQMCKVVR